MVIILITSKCTIIKQTKHYSSPIFWGRLGGGEEAGGEVNCDPPGLRCIYFFVP